MSLFGAGQPAHRAWHDPATHERYIESYQSLLGRKLLI
jgi:hypothetical protein